LSEPINTLINEQVPKPKHGVIRGSLFLSLLLNIFFITALVNTFFNNIYFRMWVESMTAPMTFIASVITGISALVGLLAGMGFIYERFKQVTTQREPRILKNRLTLCDVVAIHNPNLVTEGSPALGENEL